MSSLEWGGDSGFYYFREKHTTWNLIEIERDTWANNNYKLLVWGKKYTSEELGWFGIEGAELEEYKKLVEEAFCV